MIPLLLLIGALLAPPMPAQPAAYQYTTASPEQPIVLAAGADAPVPLEKGHAVGLEVLGSDGIVTPQGQCAVTFAAAAVGGSDVITASIEVGRRGEDGWEDIGSGPLAVPQVTAPIEPGDSLRLVVRNPGPGPVVVWPSATRLSVVALGCVAPIGPAARAPAMGPWLDGICQGVEGGACAAALRRQHLAVSHALDARIDGRHPDSNRWTGDQTARTTPGPNLPRAGLGAFVHPRATLARARRGA